jgi:hypothetical protein
MKHRLSVLVLIGVLAACGSSDDPEPAAGSEQSSDDADDTDGGGATETTVGGSGSDEPAGDGDTDDGETSGDTDTGSQTDTGDADVVDPPDEEEVAGDDGDDDDLIVISDFDDIPSECIELMGAFLREIEPTVSTIDWETATLDDIDALSTTIDQPSLDLDEASAAAGCDRYDIGVDDDQGLEFAIRVAEREAPGTVGWLQFIATLSGIGPGGDDGDGSAGGGDLPSDCEGTLEFLREQAMEYGSFTNVPVSEYADLTTAITNLQAQCTLEQLDEFSQDPLIEAFLSG